MASVLNIGERLEAIVDLCPTVKKIADIGCDHGYVTAELILEEKADMVIATEKSQDCLNKAILLADSINVTPFVSFRQGDGFEPITKYDKINCAVIAGMGGIEIIKILENRPKKLYNFVLQPMRDAPMLRQYLVNNGFDFVVDKLIKEGDKFYDVMRVTKGHSQLVDLEIYFGKDNFKDNYEVFYEYLTARQKKLMDLKASVGELRQQLEQELVYINNAIALFEQSASEN